MASNSNSAAAGGAKRPPVQNPYSKKRPRNDTSTNNNSNNNNNNGSTDAATTTSVGHHKNQNQQLGNNSSSAHRATSTSNHGMAKKDGGTSTTASIRTSRPGASTFEEAFGGIEDTDYYRTTVEDLYENNEERMQAFAAQRAEQRAFEESHDHKDDKKDDVHNQNTDEAERLKNRDNHAMLQSHIVAVSKKQRGNGVLQFIRNVPWQYSDIVPDYIMTKTTCALFLSCKYHSLHPNYIYARMAELKTDFQLRILLVLVDIDDNQKTLRELNRAAVFHNVTLILAWTEEEAARYIESYKALDGNDASMIQRKEKTNFIDQATEFLTGATSVNKTDAVSLLTQFKDLKSIARASREELVLVDGLGQKKIKSLSEAFHAPFRGKKSQAATKQTSNTMDEDSANKKDDEASLKPSSATAAITATDNSGGTENGDNQIGISAQGASEAVTGEDNGNTPSILQEKESDK